MKKQIAIMLSLILTAGTFTACRLEEKMNNDDIQTSVVSTADVSAYSETSEPTDTLPTATIKTTEKATVSKETEPSGQNTKTEEKPTVGKIRRLFRQRIRFRKHNPRFITTAGIQRTVISKNRNRPLKKKLKLLFKSLL